MKKHAFITSHNGHQYRYLLNRTWDSNKPKVGFIMLNPSIADSNIDDPAIRRLISYGKSWGCGGLYVGNLYALVSTDPKGLKKVKDCVGPQNNHFLRIIKKKCEKIIVAWGNHGGEDRVKEVLSLLGDVYCLKINQSGSPAHPLYLKRNLKPIPYNWRS